MNLALQRYINSFTGRMVIRSDYLKLKVMIRMVVRSDYLKLEGMILMVARSDYL